MTLAHFADLVRNYGTNSPVVHYAYMKHPEMRKLFDTVMRFHD